MNKKKGVRATFSIDRNLYQLLKVGSQIEGKPMSGIIDSLLKSNLTKYQNVLDEMTRTATNKK